MTRSSLVEAVARRHHLSRSAARDVVDAVLEGLIVGLCEGRRVELRGFGTLRPRHYASYTGRNPRTLARIVVPAKVLPVFRPGRALQQRVERTSAEEVR